jgi:formylglycine-generating enzyme required for sulfatase activity
VNSFQPKHAVLLCLAALPCAAKEVKPPEVPSVTSEIREGDGRTLRMLTQPPEFKAELESLAQGSIKERVAKLKKKALKDLVFFEGGRFERGTWDLDTPPPYPVRLTGFYMSRHKVTFAEFDTYTDATKTPRAGGEDSFELKRRHPLVPAGALWQRARDYCQWVGQVTGLPFDLPTEAQWEYAARSRGQLFVFPTDDGNIEHGRNVPGSREHHAMLSPSGKEYSSYPVGLFPPTPMGMYDMAGNGLDWTLDWYAEDYYHHAPLDNPKGPETGTKKVLRGKSWDEGYGGHFSFVTADRRARHPELMRLGLSGEMEQGVMANTGLRCVVNTDKPLPKP